jgi:hypothetical protein
VVLGLVVEGMLVDAEDVVVMTVESDVPDAHKTLLRSTFVWQPLLGTIQSVINQ